MLDSHFHGNIEDWGVKPILFSIGDLDIPSYSFFVLFAIVIGTLTIYLYSKKTKQGSEYMFELVLASIVGGIMGAKIPMWIYYLPQMIKYHQFNLETILSGRTILGGLIGGVLAVWIVKKN